MDCSVEPVTLVAVVSVRQRGRGQARFTDLSGRWVVADSNLASSTNWVEANADTVSLAGLIRTSRAQGR